ncbi:ribbon-helix-helix domain-containing protein [Candidatus Bathyarchaeota archaeon]|nr:ribbon-helix-helix domain-containing protein [Candidatus Bathyarchaeota archaeon]
MTANDMAKKRVTISISPEVLKWLDDQVKQRNYKDRSHAVEKLVYDRMQRANLP